MLVWNWQLLLSTLSGMGVLILLFQFPLDRWWLYWRKAQETMNASQRRLLVALGGSALAGIGTYWGLHLWEQIDNQVLAASAIAQGIIITLLLGLQLSRFVLSPQGSKQRDRFSPLTENLTAENPLKRLMAIRELTQLAIQGRLHPEQLKQLSEYFSLLFSTETEPKVRQGLLETLQLHQCWQNWENHSRQPLQPLQKVKTVSKRQIIEKTKSAQI